MKELNLIALLGFYFLCPHKAAPHTGDELLTKKIVVAVSQYYAWGEKLHNVYFLNKKITYHTSADVAIKTVEPTAAIIFSESKPIIQHGKRFFRPKIPSLPRH